MIVDISRVDAEEVADTYPDVPILGYTNHTDTAGLRAAHAAGFDQVVVKSALVERSGSSWTSSRLDPSLTVGGAAVHSRYLE